jgi:hypothetical protein
VLASSLAGSAVYVTELPGTSPLQVWSASLGQTATVVLRPTLSSGALAGALVWAVAALTLPWLVRGRSLTADALRVAAWATALVLTTASAIGIAHPDHPMVARQTAVIGGIAAALIALAPSVHGYWHTGRAHSRLS